MASAGSLHPQVDVNYNEETRKNLKLANIGPLPTIKLDAMDIISDIWERPPDRDLHVFVGLLVCPSSGYPSIPLPEGDKLVDSGFVREYKDIFIKPKQWGALRNPISWGMRYICAVRLGHQSQMLSQISNKIWIAGRVWPLTCVVSLTTLLMLTGQCRRITLMKISMMLDF